MLPYILVEYDSRDPPSLGLNGSVISICKGLDLIEAQLLFPLGGFTLDDSRRMLEVGAVDCLQADATHTGGVTGFLCVAALCEAHHVDLSGHCAPAMHLHAALSAPGLRHLEWFHDHVRIERMLFDGAPVPENGAIRADLSRPGHGLALRRADAERYRAK